MYKLPHLQNNTNGNKGPPNFALHHEQSTHVLWLRFVDYLGPQARE